MYIAFHRKKWHLNYHLHNSPTAFDLTYAKNQIFTDVTPASEFTRNSEMCTSLASRGKKKKHPKQFPGS